MITNTSQNQIQEMNYHEISKQETVVDVKYQNIIYYMDNKTKKVSQKQKTQIDFIKNETAEFVKWYSWLHKEMPELRKLWEKELK